MLYESQLSKLSIANRDLKREKCDHNRSGEQFKRKKRLARLKSRESHRDIVAGLLELQSKDENAAQLTLKESQIKRDNLHEV